MSAKIKQKIEQKIAAVINHAALVVLVTPPSDKPGDYSWPVFELAKKQGVSPIELAKTLAEKLSGELTSVAEKVQAVGPYLNIFVNRAAASAEILSEKIAPAKKKKAKIVLDVFQANPLKLFHIGHLFNATLGESIRRLLSWQGYQTVTYSYSGDVGIHVARWLWYFKNFYRGVVPKKEFTRWAGEIYAAASAKVAENPAYAEEAAEVNRQLAARDKRLMTLWRQMTKRSYAASWQIARELACQVDFSFPESVCEAPGKKFVQQKIAAGKLKLDQGAWGVDLGEWDLGFFILLKSDGTALYQTKDQGLGLLRQKKIKNYAKCLMVVGTEQSYYFQQLFKTFEVLRHPDAGKCQHVPHGLVSLKEGKMASRLGNVISYDELRDKTEAKILSVIEEKNPQLKNKIKAAKIIASGALKFSLLHVDRKNNSAFDWEAALSFTGNSGPYLQYTYARIRSIERKAKQQKIRAAVHSKKSEWSNEEWQLIKKLGEFAEVVARAAAEYQPYLVANYLLDLAASFNHFYQHCQVVDAANLAQSRERLLLCAKTAEVLKTGLRLLGINTVEEM